MISEACYKPHAIFALLLVKDCIGIEIVEIKCLNSLSRWKKKKLREQFIQIVEAPFYFMYFVKSTSSIPS